MKLMIAELRKNKGVSQQELATVMGVAHQTVSKWETNVTFPDITLLPQLAQYFEVSVDELLGLKPLPSLTYISCEAGTKDYWSKRLKYLKSTRDFLWNKDYLQFLIEKVWKINNPILCRLCRKEVLIQVLITVRTLLMKGETSLILASLMLSLYVMMC